MMIGKIVSIIGPRNEPIMDENIEWPLNENESQKNVNFNENLDNASNDMPHELFHYFMNIYVPDKFNAMFVDT